MTSHAVSAAARKLAILAVSGAALSACSHPAARPAAGGITVLSCRDSAGPQGADPAARSVNGVESAAWHGDTNAYDTLPRWRGRDGHRYLIWKTYLAVAPEARPYRTITVTSPASARLFYASPARWGTASGAAVISPPPRAVRLAACGRRFAGFTGGILVARPACVTLKVTGPAGKPATVTVPILVTRC
ncbi:MAG TPA: hypothetical protein VII59_11595 [Streptosporangiaceae bacterium]|jgi:hypothetical protein